MGDDDRQLKYINVGMEFTNKVTQKILDNLDEDEQAEQLEIMREVMKEYIKMEHEYNVSKTVLGKLKKGLEVEAADMDRDIDEDYKNHLASELEKDPVTEYGVTHDKRYRHLESIISGSGNATLGDDDLMVTEETQEFKDPWTRKLIEDPVTNKECGHTYERSTVERFLASNAKSRKALKCPVVGCTNNNITKAQLGTDANIKRQIMKQKSRR